MAGTNRKGTTHIVKTFMSSAVDRRTKLHVGLIKKFNAGYGDRLYFYQENNVIAVTKSPIKGESLLFSISVDVENRARLTEANLEQIGAVFGDVLEFEFSDNSRAIVTVQRRQSSDEELNIYSLPEEVEDSHTYIEGATRQIIINAYERDPKARHACIEHYGLDCFPCGFNFEERYGELGRDYIHVHHLTPISSVG
ncbi:MAG TPA: hypothetical protein VK619_13185 [Pyrinomonadaceae bacterium]|nr:hypothetical protein [Pyrinomonadaceae bacterium]